jgi:hypothetical protein
MGFHHFQKCVYHTTGNGTVSQFNLIFLLECLERLHKRVLFFLEKLNEGLVPTAELVYEYMQNIVTLFHLCFRMLPEIKCKMQCCARQSRKKIQKESKHRK